METTTSVALVLLVVVAYSGVILAAPQDLGSPIRIAQCRALCLEKFVRTDRHETLCQQDPDCFTCWENCGLLQDNPTVWSRICSQPSVCFPGCLQACQFFQNADLPQKDPVMPTSAEPTVQLVGNLATWPRPAADRSGSTKREKERLVYAVIQKQSSGRWRQIIQTAEERCFIPSGETASSMAAGNLRVLAVGGKGLVALYRPEHEDSSTENAIAAPILPSSDMVVDTATAPAGAEEDQAFVSIPDISIKMPASSQWKLREVSLIHQKVLVIAEVAWPVQHSSDGQASDYLVTWEVDGGGLKGHLYTDATSVTLSLWPDTVYHIQVDLVTATSDAIQLRSSPLTIDTHKAPVVQSEESRPLPAAPLVDRLPSGGTSGSGRRLEATVGVGAAAGISLFLLVLATAIGVRRHRQATLRLAGSNSRRPDYLQHHRSIESLTAVKTIDVERVPYLVQPCAVHSLQHCISFPSRGFQQH